MGGAGDDWIIGISKTPIDLVDDAVDIDPSFGSIEELRLVLLLGNEVCQLDASLLVAIAGAIDPVKKFPGSGHQIGCGIGRPIQCDPDSWAILRIILTEAVGPEEYLHPSYEESIAANLFAGSRHMVRQGLFQLL